MAYKFVVFVAILAYAHGGIIGAPAIATYSAGPALAAYSAAPAVSSSYIHQATSPIAVAHAAPVAVAHASPIVSTYSASPLAIHTPSIGASHQSVERSLGGAQSVSHYSKAVDSAFSSVRKYDTRITNDALTLGHAPVAPVVSAYAAHAPIVSSYSAPYLTKTVAAPVATYAAAAAPVAAYAAAAPVIKSAVAYSPAAVVSHATFSGFGAAYSW